MEWESLCQQPGKIDEYLDQVTQLVWQTGYSRDIIKDTITQGLTSHLRPLWGIVIDIPVNLPSYIDGLRKLSHLNKQTIGYQ